MYETDFKMYIVETNNQIYIVILQTRNAIEKNSSLGFKQYNIGLYILVTVFAALDYGLHHVVSIKKTHVCPQSVR